MAKFSSYDAYIEAAQPFAQPILNRLRDCVHEACPECKEEFKWSFPNFTYNGSILCSMAAFKQHVSFGFWLGSQMKDPYSIFLREADGGMGHLGKMTSLEDLPAREILLEYIREAMLLVDSGVKSPSSSRAKKAKALEAPNYLLDRLRSETKAMATFEAFPQSHRNEYIEWITEAKTEATRERRIVQMLEWLEEGKSRNWKYVKN